MTKPHLGLNVEITSEAPFIKLGQHKFGTREDIVETETYSVKFKFKNLEKISFPLGNATLQVCWNSNQWVRWPVTIPKLKPGEEQYAKFPSGSMTEKSEALSSGFALIYCTSTNPPDTKLSSLSGEIEYPVGLPGSVRSLKATTWDTIYSKYSMFIAAGALGVIALQIIAQSLFWFLSLLHQVPK